MIGGRGTGIGVVLVIPFIAVMIISTTYIGYGLIVGWWDVILIGLVWVCIGAAIEWVCKRIKKEDR